MSQPKLTKVQRRCVEAAAEILAAAGLAVELRHNGRNHIVLVTAAGRMTVTCSPKNADLEMKAARSRARSLLRRAGRAT